MTDSEPTRGDDDLFRPGAIAVRLLLALSAWPQARLAELSGVDQATISLLQRGLRDPTDEQLQALCRAAGWPLPFVWGMARSSARLQQIGEERAFTRLEGSAEAAGRAVELHLLGELSGLVGLVSTDPPRPTPEEDDLEVAEDLWERLADLTPRQRRLLVDVSARFDVWALALRLGRAGMDAAIEHPEEGRSLAELGLHVADRSLGPEDFLNQVRGLAWGAIGIVHHAAGDEGAGRAALVEARQRWPAGAPPMSQLISAGLLERLEVALGSREAG